MGAYSSKPATETITEEGSNGCLSYGASAMQGWRTTQEDAHVALLDFDDGPVKSHLFAVFDGHGGAEVAQFASQFLPTWVKQLPAFREGDVGKALTEAFLSFDQHLTEKPVIEQLKLLADDAGSEAADEDDELNEAIMLQEEADMPIEKLLLKYGHKQPDAQADRIPAEVCVKSEGPAASSSSAGSSSSSSKHHPQTIADPAQPSDRSPAAPVPTPNGEVISHAAQNGGSSHDDTVSANGVEKLEIADEPIREKVPEAKAEESVKKDDEVQNGESEAPKKVDKGKQRKVIVPKPKRKVKPAATYQQFLDDCDEEDESSEDDEPFGPALNSDSEDEQPSPNVRGDDDEDDDEEEDDEEEDDEEESESSDDEEDEQIMFGYSPPRDFEEPGKDSGCTAVVAVVRGDTLFVANAGDSRCVVSCNGKAIEMSEDHKPEDERELERIQKAGGKVTIDGRVNGGLNLSRALGDHTYKANPDLPLKEQMISPEPDIRQLQITPEHEFMILACDGIWNSMSSQEVVDFVRSRLDQMKPAKICEELFAHCLAPDTSGDGTGCDNMTAIVVTFDEYKQFPKRKIDDEVEATERTAKKVKDDGNEPQS